MQLNILAEYLGAEDTYYGLHALFVKRLGWNLYRPIGEEWRQRGFYKIGTPLNLNFSTSDAMLIDGVYHIPAEMEYTQKGITFDTFQKMDIDIIVTTCFANELAFDNLAKTCKPKALFIRHIANIQEKPQIAKNVLLATLEPMPKGINYMIYCPESSGDYGYTPPNNQQLIRSFSHNLTIYPTELNSWNLFKTSLPEFTFEMYGHNGLSVYSGCKTSYIPHKLMPQAIKESTFVWHTKPNGCGGHIPRQAIKSGRPCIVKRTYCNNYNSLCKKIYRDVSEGESVNCIDLDLRSFNENVKLIREYSEPHHHLDLCRKTAESFTKIINHAEEAQRIKEWIENMVRK